MVLDQVRRIFTLNMGIFWLKYSMNLLMNLMHHLSVASALCVGGWLRAWRSRIESARSWPSSPASASSTIRGAIWSLVARVFRGRRDTAVCRRRRMARALSTADTGRQLGLASA